MNTETFLENFHTIANAPNGIARLREMILQLAVQGKLVEQNPNDEPASELLKKIEDEKLRVLRDLRGKKNITTKDTKSTKGGSEAIKDEDKPYKLPSNWEWVRLGDISEIVRGGSPRPAGDPRYYNGDIPFLKVGDLTGYEDIYLKTHTYTIKKAGLYKTRFVEADTLMLTNSGATLGIPRICTFPTTFNDGIAAFLNLNHINKVYIYYFLKSKTAWYLKEASRGQGQPNLNINIISNTLFPLPPLAEQKRIVAKVDSLMALCDRLEELQKKKVELNSLTRKTAFSVLGNANEPSEFKAAWARVEVNTKYLLDSEEAVEEMKKTILQNAIKGNLVPQDPNDEPASELLKKIEAEKEKSLTTKSAKNTKGGIEPIKDEDKPYKLPSNWEWVRLDWLGITQTGTTPPTKDPSNYGNFIPFIGPGNIKDGKIDYNKEGLSNKGINYSRLIPAKSILMVCIGGSIGKSAINEIDITCNQQINFITPFKNTDTRYLYYSMISPTFQGKVIGSSRGLATPIINKNTWSLLPIFLPPLEEQKRIVEKVDSLFAICDRLQKQLADAKSTAANLAKAAVESLTGIQSTEKEKMKAPKTELVSILRLSKAPTVKDKAPLSAILLKHKESMSAKNLWMNSGMEIDQFYQQLKTEMANGWIVEPEKAYMQVVE